MKFSHILALVGLGAVATECSKLTVGPMTEAIAKALKSLQRDYRRHGAVYIPLIDLEICHPPKRKFVKELLPKKIVNFKGALLRKMSRVEMAKMFTGTAAPYNVIKMVDSKYFSLDGDISLEGKTRGQLDNALYDGVEQVLTRLTECPLVGRMGEAALALFRRSKGFLVVTIYEAIERDGINATAEAPRIFDVLEPFLYNCKHKVVVKEIIKALPQEDDVHNPTVEEVLEKYPERNEMRYIKFFEAIMKMRYTME